MLWAQVFYLVISVFFGLGYLVKGRSSLAIGNFVGIIWAILAGCIDKLSNCQGSYGWQVSLICFQLIGLIISEGKMPIVLRTLLILLAGGFDLVLGWPS